MPRRGAGYEDPHLHLHCYRYLGGGWCVGATVRTKDEQPNELPRVGTARSRQMQSTEEAMSIGDFMHENWLDIFILILFAILVIGDKK